MGKGLFLGDQPRPPFQGGVAPAGPNFAGSTLLVRIRLDLEQSNSVWSDNEEGVF